MTPTTWTDTRRRFATSAHVTALLTAALMAGLGIGPLSVVGYLAMVLVATHFAPGITFQVGVGLLLIAGRLVTPVGPPAALLTGVLAGVVLTAELLAVVARFDTPVECEPRGDMPAALRSTAIASGVYLAVVLLSGLPGPAGVLSVALAAAVLAWMGRRLGRAAA